MINILMNQKRGLNRFSKLPDDGDPWTPNNLLTPEQKKITSWTPPGQATDKKLRPQPTKMNSFMSGSDARPTGVQLKRQHSYQPRLG